MKIRSEKTQNETIIKFEGSIDEETNFESIQYESYLPIVLDLKDVEAINSYGVREWVKWIQKPPVKAIHLINCPPSIIEQVNQIENFLGHLADIESFYVPYFCEECHKVQNQLIKASEHQDDYNTIEKYVRCDECGRKAEMDVFAGNYFRFLTQK